MRDLIVLCVLILVGLGMVSGTPKSKQTSTVAPTQPPLIDLREDTYSAGTKSLNSMPKGATGYKALHTHPRMRQSDDLRNDLDVAGESCARIERILSRQHFTAQED